MKRNIAILNRAGRLFGTGFLIKPNGLFRRLAGNLPGILLWLAVLPLAALGQANYATPYTFITLVGRVGIAGSTDGTNSTVRFNYPVGVTVDTNGTLYVSEVGNNTIRAVKPVGTSWVVTTVAGLAGSPGSVDGTNSAARFNFTVNVGGLNYFGCGPAVDSAGNVYLPDAGNNTIRKITPVGTNWVVTTLAGKAGASGSADGTNGAARFYWPVQVVVDSAGTLYDADSGSSTIRKITPDGTNWVVTTVAGVAGVAGSTDGTGSAARFNFMTGAGGAVAMDSAGKLYVPDWGNNTIREGMLASSVPPPILQLPSLSTGAFGFGITGLPGLAVNIESSTNLSQWGVVRAGLVLTGGTNYYSVSPDPAQGAQFYRAHLR
jgi:hypothetical protein